MVPPSEYQSKQHTFSLTPSHHRATISLKFADMRGVGGYDVGYYECSCTTNFVTAPGRLDIVRVFDAMVPPADYQPNKHTLLTLPSDYRATLALRPADVGSVGGYDFGYDECFCTTDFATATGRLYIVCVSNDMTLSADNQSKQHTFLTPPYHHRATLSLRPVDVGGVGWYDVGYNAPPPDYQSKQHTFSMPPSHHWATISFRPAGVGIVGRYDIG